ncbi:MAG: RNA polymerase sigma factor RpoD/SigA [bacterium]|nr:RNA polymerase sigma factor RpoD/SigA [bacterium]
MVATAAEGRRFGEDRSLEYYFREVDRYPQVDPEEEQALAARIEKGDDEALTRLVNANLRFVIHVARSFQNQGLPLADLINEGNMGLLRAARKFNRHRNCKFITYAVWWIRQNILKALEVQTRPIRVPANVLNDLGRLRKAQDHLAQSLERDPSFDELAAEVRFSPRKVRHTFESTVNTVSVDISPEEDGEELSLGDALPDLDVRMPDEELFEQDLGRDMGQVLERLSGRHQQVLALYFGMDGGEPATYQEIGRRLGISRERVRQLKEDAFNKLRQPSVQKRLVGYL